MATRSVPRGRLVGHHVHVDVTGAADDGHRGTRPDELGEAAVPRGTDNDLRSVDAASEIQYGAGDVVADDEVEASTQALHEQPLALDLAGRRTDRSVRPDDVHRDQIAICDPTGDPGSAADQQRSLGAPGQCHHHPLPGHPGAGDAVFPAVPFETLVDPIGHPEQRQLAQRRQVALAEVVAQCGVDGPGRVDVPVRHPAAERLRGHVDQLHLVGGAHHRIGHRLTLGHAGDAGHHVVQ